jgi:hypothetical protein
MVHCMVGQSVKLVAMGVQVGKIRRCVWVREGVDRLTRNHGYKSAGGCGMPEEKIRLVSHKQCTL